MPFHYGGTRPKIIDFAHFSNNCYISIEAEIVGKEVKLKESNFAMFGCFYENTQQEEVISVQEEIRKRKYENTLRKDSLETNSRLNHVQLCSNFYREEVNDLQSDSFAKDF